MRRKKIKILTLFCAADSSTHPTKLP